MTFLSPSFIFVFLPIAIAVYTMAPKLRRVDLLPMLSAVFFVCVNIHDILSLTYYFSIAIASAVTLKIYKKKKRRRYLIMLEILAFAAAVVALLYRFIFGTEAVYHAGLLMCLMATMSMCSDISKNEGRVPDTIWEALIYVTFFPVMLAGPFVRYGDFIEKLDGVSFSTDKVLVGLERFIIGFIKCVAISAILGKVYDGVMEKQGEFGFFVCVLIAAVCGVRIYTFFSGYSDMARGIALMIGFDLKKDFKDPFANVTPADYAKRFFRSLSEFAKLYIVQPIDALFGGHVTGKLLACFMAASYYVFILCPSPDVAIAMFLPSFILAYLILLRPKSKRLNVHALLKVPFAILTFVTVSFAWVLISLGSVDSFVIWIVNALENPAFYASYGVKEIIFSREYIWVPTVVSVLIYVISKTLKVESVDDTNEISVKELVVRASFMTVLAIIFIFAVVMILPKVPDVVSYANVFRFV